MVSETYFNSSYYISGFQYAVKSLSSGYSKSLNKCAKDLYDEEDLKR